MEKFINLIDNLPSEYLISQSWRSRKSRIFCKTKTNTLTEAKLFTIEEEWASFPYIYIVRCVLSETVIPSPRVSSTFLYPPSMEAFWNIYLCRVCSNCQEAYMFIIRIIMKRTKNIFCKCFIDINLNIDYFHFIRYIFTSINTRYDTQLIYNKGCLSS